MRLRKALCVDSTSFSQARYDLGKLQIKGQRISEEERDLNIKKISIPLIMLIDPRTIVYLKVRENATAPTSLISCSFPQRYFDFFLVAYY
jgi:hypothetical protein